MVYILRRTTFVAHGKKFWFVFPDGIPTHNTYCNGAELYHLMLFGNIDVLYFAAFSQFILSTLFELGGPERDQDD